MNKDNLMFAIIGLLLGFIIGFMVHSVLSQRESAPRGPMQQTQSMPPNHPPVSGDQAGDTGQQMLASVQTAMKQARENPNDFEAQLTAAKLEYQIQRFDQAIEYLLAANKIKPADFEPLPMLRIANRDAEHYNAAAKWYKAALLK